MRQVTTVNQLSETPVEIWIDETSGAEKVELRQGSLTVTLQHDRAEAVIGGIRYGVGEIQSTPA